MGNDSLFQAPDRKEILQIIKLIDESDFEELKLQIGHFQLFISKKANFSMLVPDQFPTREEITEDTSGKVTEFNFENEAVASEEPPTASSVALEDAPSKDEGLVPIRAPLLGIFYRSPKPGAPPFVEVGSQVSEEDSVCLIEVMKLFNSVKSGVRGRIAKICAENNEMVEYGQELFLVEPE